MTSKILQIQRFCMKYQLRRLHILHNFMHPVLSSSTPFFRPYVRPFDETGIVVAAAILFTFLAMGLFGNILTIIVILKTSELR